MPRAASFSTQTPPVHHTIIKPLHQNPREFEIQTKMEGSMRSWEDMEVDCLASIFQRLRLEDLTLAVPFVCKSWLGAALDPLCWRLLDFTDMDFVPWSDFTRKIMPLFYLHKFGFSIFLRFVVSKSHASTTELKFPSRFSASLQDLFYVSNQCPALKIVVLPHLLTAEEPHIPAIVGKWKDLERLEMPSKPSSFVEMVSQINLHCKNFSELVISAGSIKEEDVSAIADHLPKLKHLCLRRAYLPEEQLLGIIDGCKELEALIVDHCIGFEADERMIERASKIKRFEYENSKLFDDMDYDTDECDPLGVQVI